MQIIYQVLKSTLTQMDKAVELYGKAVDIQPLHAEAHCNLGVIHKNAGRLDKAIAAYESALAAAPNFEIVKCNLAVALTEKATRVKENGDPDQSMSIFPYINTSIRV